VNDKYFPSGLQRGVPSLSLLKVICRSLVLSYFASQMCVLLLSFFASMVLTV